MACKCSSTRIMSVSGKCSDMCSVFVSEELQRNDYVPRNLNIGGGDYLEFKVCLDCGTIQGEWPVTEETLQENLL